MNIKTELLKKHITDYINNHIENYVNIWYNSITFLVKCQNHSKDLIVGQLQLFFAKSY